MQLKETLALISSYSPASLRWNYQSSLQIRCCPICSVEVLWTFPSCRFQRVQWIIAFGLWYRQACLTETWWLANSSNGLKKLEMEGMVWHFFLLSMKVLCVETHFVNLTIWFCNNNGDKTWKQFSPTKMHAKRLASASRHSTASLMKESWRR